MQAAAATIQSSRCSAVLPRQRLVHRHGMLGRITCTGRRPAFTSSSLLVCYAGDKDKDGPLGLVSSAVDSLTNMVPESVPRPVAKTGVTVLGGLLVISLLQKVVSGLFTLVVMGALGYWWLTKSAPEDDVDLDDVPKKGKSPASTKKGDLDDPLLDDVERIMKKYK